MANIHWTLVCVPYIFYIFVLLLRYQYALKLDGPMDCIEFKGKLRPGLYSMESFVALMRILQVSRQRKR